MKMPFIPYDKDAAFEQTARYLPHREQSGRTYFITWRLGDSVPLEVLTTWKDERTVFLATHPKPWDADTQKDYDERFQKRLERWADEGYGACHLSVPEMRAILVEALRRFEGDRYELDSFVVMPNHVHVLVRPYGWSGAVLEQSVAELQPASGNNEEQAKALQHSGRGLAGSAQGTAEYQRSLSGILKQWKGGSSRAINLHLGRTGALWMDESFDHLVRSEAQLRRFREYIRENPLKAHLPEGTFTHWESVAAL